MVQNKKRIISLILMLTLLVSSLVVGAITASAAEETTISFASTAQRVSRTSTAQVWKNGDVTFTNNKASSSTAVANYSNPVRLYQNSEVIVSVPSGNQITKIVFECNNTTYATALKNSIGSEATASGKQITLTLATPAESYTIAKLTAQVRLNSLTVTYKAASTEPDAPTCEHTNKVAIGEAKDPTCTETGITAGVKCVDCGKELEVQETIDALGHNYVNGVCVRCDTEKPKEGNYYLQATVNGTTYYWNGSVSSGKGGLTTNVNEAVKLVVEVNNNVTYVYYVDNIGIKQYVSVASNSNTAFKIGTDAQSIDFDSEKGYLYSASCNRYVATYGTQDIRTYQTSNIPGSSNNTYMIMTSAQTVCVHTPVDEGEVTAPTCTEDGFINHICSKCGERYVVDGEKALDHSFDDGTVTKAATCTATGIKTCTCTRKECGATTTVVIPVIDHNLVNNVCSVCNYKVPTAKFELGENGSNASEATNALGNYSETVGDYTLTLSELTKVYEAKDGLGNGCLKLGTGSAQGSFSFTVPNDIISVTIMVSGRQTKTAIVVVNDITYEIATTSDSGEYTAITVDTTTNKTVSFATAKNGDEFRAMVDSIMFYACNHEYNNACDAECNICGENRTITHTLTQVEAKAPTCTAVGYDAYEYCSVCNYTTYNEIPVDANAHYAGCGHYAAEGDSLQAALGNGSVELTKPVSVSGALTILSGATLDLKGQTLTADAVVTFNGTIIDTVGTGKIIVNAGKLEIAAGNYKYAPIHVETVEGKSTYVITPVKVQGVDVELDNTAIVRPSLKGQYTNKELFADEVIAHGISFHLVVTRDNGVDEPESVALNFTEKQIKTLYSDNKHAIRINLVGGLEGYTYTVELVVESAGVQVHSTEVAILTVPVTSTTKEEGETTND